MLDGTLLGIMVTLFLAPIAVWVWWALLRALDRAAGIDFKDRVRTWSAYDHANYSGRRAIAVALLIGLIFSRFI